jgi:hypothetical protein
MPHETAIRLIALAETADPVTAYLLAWTAFEHLVKVVAREAGVRAKFQLRRNGTVQTTTVGRLKLPIVTPPRPEHEMEVALSCLPAATKDALVAHPAVRTLALRVPRFEGRPLVRDARGQRLSGVLDLAYTSDARYPVWRALDTVLIRAHDQGALTPEQRDALVAQLAALLVAIQRNLLLGDDDGAAELGLPLVKLLVEGLQAGAG